MKPREYLSGVEVKLEEEEEERFLDRRELIGDLGIGVNSLSRYPLRGDSPPQLSTGSDCWKLLRVGAQGVFSRRDSRVSSTRLARGCTDWISLPRTVSWHSASLSVVEVTSSCP